MTNSICVCRLSGNSNSQPCSRLSTSRAGGAELKGPWLWTGEPGRGWTNGPPLNGDYFINFLLRIPLFNNEDSMESKGKLKFNMEPQKSPEIEKASHLNHPPPWLWGSKCWCSRGVCPVYGVFLFEHHFKMGVETDGSIPLGCLFQHFLFWYHKNGGYEGA